MKRLIFFSLIAVWASMALAHDFEVNGIYYVKKSDGTSVSVSYRGTSSSQYSNEYSGSVNIPPSVTYSGKTYDVTSIGYGAFYDCSRLTSVTIPNSVTSIGSSAFAYCSDLTSVTIPNSVKAISEGTFEDCSGLTSVTIGNAVTYIGKKAFFGCNNLKTVNWNAKNCSNFSDDSTPFHYYEAGGGYRDNYTLTGITTFNFGNEVEKIPAWLCYGLSGLTSVTIGNSVTSIGNSAFSSCRGLKTVNWNAKDCGDFTSAPFSSNATISFGNEVEKIPAYLCNNSKITSLSIPNSVTSIGSYAFEGCSNIQNLAWNPKNCTSMGDMPKTNISTVAIGDGVEILPDNFVKNSKITSITIPNSVKTISDYAFQGCSGLTSVTIGKSVTSIGNSAFYGCSGLTKVEVSDLAAWCRISFGSSESNPLYYAKHLYLNGSEIKDLIIPNSVKTIGNSAFYNCSGLTSVTFGFSVTSIGNYAFSGCSGLTSIEILNSVTSIGSYAFSGCSGLTSVTIPNSVTSIGTYAFSGCSGLTSVTIGNSVTSIGDAAFSGCSGLTKVKISDLAAWCRISFGNLGSNPLYNAHQLFLNGSEIKDLVIPNSVTSIGDYAFCGCRGLSYGSGLTSVTIPNSVTSIGDYAFHECQTLTSATIGNSVTSIGEDAFSNSGLRSVTIGNAVTSIGKKAFFGCNNLKTVNWNAKNCSDFSGNSTPFYQSSQYSEYNSTLTAIQTFNFGNEVEKIPAYLCYKLSGLTSVTIPDSVKEIGVNAFGGTLWFSIQPLGLVYAGKVAYKYKGTMPSGTSIAINEGTVSITPYCFSSCGGLTSVTIPNSVTSIGDYAFSDCSELTSVVIPNSITRINSGTFSGCSGLKSVYMFPNSVTEIGESAFSGCENMSSVTIANSVKTIGSSAFKDCVGLHCVTNLSARPQRIDGTVFGNVNVKGCTLLVPAESVAFYQNVSYWQDFLINAGVEGVEVDAATKEVEGYYDLKGIRLNEPIRGQVNIIRYKDGTAKKIVN